MLGLKCETNSEWVERVSTNASVLLSDHAHCEKKAALMAISLINQYPERSELVEEMSDLAVEEINHFRMVLKKMNERNLQLLRDAGDIYVQQLNAEIRKQEPLRFLDRLIVLSLIEARSCERFSILSEESADRDLREFYHSLLASEARHRNTFLKLAKIYFPENEVAIRLRELEDFEAELVSSLPSEPVMHG